MTRHFSPPAIEATAVSAVLIDAARCWREARDGGQSVQARLARALDPHDCAMLAPVFDSLCLFYEAALGRPMRPGAALDLSDDEHLLLGLVDGSKPRRCLDCPSEVGATLDCALCSTRIMLALTLRQPIEQAAV
ncbi:MAG: hypothetical protein QM690_20095 [Sphingobium sp.]